MDLRTIVDLRNSVLYFLVSIHYFALLEAFMFISSQRGQGLVEYAMIIMLVGIIVIVMLALFGSGVGNMFSNVIANF